MLAVQTRMLALALGFATLACSSDSTGPGDSTTPVGSNAPVTGTYNLREVNGAAVPAWVEGGIRVMGATLTFNAPNTFSGTLTYQVISGGQTVSLTETCTGTYTVSGTSVAFTAARSDGTACSGKGGSDGGQKLTVAFGVSLQMVLFDNVLQTVFEK